MSDDNLARTLLAAKILFPQFTERTAILPMEKQVQRLYRFEQGVGKSVEYPLDYVQVNEHLTLAYSEAMDVLAVRWTE